MLAIIVKKRNKDLLVDLTLCTEAPQKGSFICGLYMGQTRYRTLARTLAPPRTLVPPDISSIYKSLSTENSTQKVFQVLRKNIRFL